MNEAWFSALGESLGDDERREVADYPADPEWLALNEALHGASYAAYQAASGRRSTIF